MMEYLAKILALAALVIAVAMVLTNVLHAKDYIVAAVSLAIGVLAAAYEYRKK